jgi:hypothetical protein
MIFNSIQSQEEKMRNQLDIRCKGVGLWNWLNKEQLNDRNGKSLRGKFKTLALKIVPLTDNNYQLVTMRSLLTMISIHSETSEVALLVRSGFITKILNSLVYS